MTRDEALAILDMPREQAVDIILVLADKAEKYDQLCENQNPNTPSGMIPVYMKTKGKKRPKKPGRKKGHPGTSRPKPDKVTNFKNHPLHNCPHCQTKLGKPIQTYKRYIEDIPRIKPEITEHTVHGYWCSHCKKIVYPIVTDAFPNSSLGLRLVIFSTWLHYIIGMSVNNITKILSTILNFKVTTGCLTQAWNRLACLLEPYYKEIGQTISKSAVLHADETGWRISGNTHWLWVFTNKEYCYYLITKCRGSPVIQTVLGKIFDGILICDFWGAYNKVFSLAKQRCLYHLFTELIKVDKHNCSPDWKAFRKKLYRLLKDAIQLSIIKNQMNKETYEKRCNRINQRLDELLLSGCSQMDKDVRRVIKRLKRHRDELFTFLYYEGVSPYNNQAEQMLRRPVLIRKISQQNRSDQGALTQAIMMTLFKSFELQDVNPFNFVLYLTKCSLKSKLAEKDGLKLAS